ncbi:MAG: SRPBCC domain-containing protein [Novosphingobium sp.]
MSRPDPDRVDPTRTDRASRVIAASAAQVYAALTDGRMVQHWLPPEGATGTVEVFDPRPGGRFRMTLRFATGEGGKTGPDTDTITGRFLDLDPDEYVAQEFDFVSADPAFAGTMRMTWGLTWCAEGTEVSVTAENVPPGIDPDDHAAGLASSLANLAAFLEHRS